MVEPCLSLIDFSVTCEWSNISTMIIELTIAGIMAIGLSIFFYRRQDHQRRKIDRLFLHQQQLKFDRHIHITENISRILKEIKSHFEVIQELVDYQHNSASSSKNMVSSPIDIHSKVIVENLEQLEKFLLKYQEDIDITFDSEIQIILKSVGNFDFKNPKPDQFILKSKEIIEKIEYLINLNEEISENYQQNEFWGKDFTNKTDKETISKMNNLEKKEKEERKKLTELNDKFWKDNQHPHNEDLEKNYQRQKKISENKIVDINNELKKLKNE